MDDGLVKVAPMIEIVGDWKIFLNSGNEKEIAQIRKHEMTGRPLGDEAFVEKLEVLLERTLKRQKPGPKTKKISHN